MGKQTAQAKEVYSAPFPKRKKNWRPGVDIAPPRKQQQFNNNKLKVEICVKVTSRKILSTEQFLRAACNFFPG